MPNAERILAELMTTKGPDCLHTAPMSVYKTLLQSDVSPRLARILLSAVLAGAAEKAADLSAEELSADFQNSCGLRKDAADEAAQIFAGLFSPASIEARKAKEGAGFSEFCETVWEYSWSGEATWHAGGVHIDCAADVEASIAVENVEVARQTAAKLLEKNPFANVDAIREVFARLLSATLDDSLEMYVTAEKYYEPVMEDYWDICESDLQECCKQLGLRLEHCDVSAGSSDYIPD